MRFKTETQTYTAAWYHSTHVIVSNVIRAMKALEQQVDYLLVFFRCVVQTQQHVMETPDSLDLNTLPTERKLQSLQQEYNKTKN